MRQDGGVPTYVAFLRAINLGATRKFPKAGIVAAVEAAGGEDVETYINTGNVRFTMAERSRAKVERALEKAFADEAGFDVPTIVLTPKELVAVAAAAERLRAEHGEPQAHYITLYKKAPGADAVRALPLDAYDDEAVHVDGRAAHAMLHRSFHQTRLLNSKEFKALGEGTARNVTVLRTLAEKWG
jgi:uncharacterized protein (DUF1697 family)